MTKDHLLLAGQILPGERSRIIHDLLRRPLRDDFAAVNAGAGSDIDDIIRGENRVLVVLDDDDAVAEIAQPPQRVEQTVIVALMQPDRRFVQHIENAGQPRADLRREADPLAFAARQRA